MLASSKQTILLIPAGAVLQVTPFNVLASDHDQNAAIIYGFASPPRANSALKGGKRCSFKSDGIRQDAYLASGHVNGCGGGLQLEVGESFEA